MGDRTRAAPCVSLASDDMTERARQYAQDPLSDTLAACPLAAASCAQLDRRTLLSNAAVTAAAAMLSACGLGADPTAPASLTPQSIKVSTYPQLANVNGVALISASGSPIAVVRTGQDSFVALSRICPHRGATIVTASTGFECPKHHARFGPTGNWTGGERTSNMRSYPAAYDATTDMLTIG